MENLYLIGGSGSGKTTLARTLEAFFPEKFSRFLEISTRQPRDGEINMDDYEFMSTEELFRLKENKELFEIVEYQFGESRYGGRKSFLKEDKCNVIVASIEGILSGLKNTSKTDRSVILNIVIDTDLDVARENRAPNTEQDYNLAVLRNLFDLELGIDVEYYEIPLSKLKEIRNSKELLKEYLEEIFNF